MMDYPEISDATLTLDDCENEHQYVNCQITGSTMSVHLAATVFVHCEFTGDFTDSELLDVQIERSNLANTDWAHSTFSGALWTGCRLTGANLDACRMIQCQFTECSAQMMNLSESSLEKCRFDHCDFTEASMQDVRVKPKISWPDCQFEGVSLQDTRLAKWDLSKAIFTNLTVSPELLAGLTIASWQAVALVDNLGVKIRS